MKEPANTARVLVAAMAVFAAALAGAAEVGALAKIVAFLALFALATYALDDEVRSYVREALRKAPGPSPGASPGAPSSARTSAPGWDATRGQPGD